MHAQSMSCHPFLWDTFFALSRFFISLPYLQLTVPLIVIILIRDVGTALSLTIPNPSTANCTLARRALYHLSSLPPEGGYFQSGK